MIIQPHLTKYSREERLETTNDATDKIRHTVESFKDRLTSDNLRLAERYSKAKLKILVAGTFIGRSGNVCNFLAEYQRAGCLDEWNSHFSYIGPPSTDTGCDREQEPMLVSNVELMEIPERIVPSYVRLHFADEFFRTRGDRLYFSLADGRCVLLGTLANREISVPVRRAASGFDELPNEMVKRTPEIVNSIADDKRKLTWNRMDFGDIKRHMLDFRLFLSGENIRLRVTEGVKLRVQNFNVLFGPFNFEPDSSNSVHNETDYAAIRVTPHVKQ